MPFRPRPSRPCLPRLAHSLALTVVPLLGYHISPSFIVTKYYPLGTLKAYLASHSWSKPLTFNLLTQVAEGMAFLHQNEIVHHDLKADNVLVEETDGRVVAKISDFGLAKIRQPSTDSSLPAEYKGATGATVRFAPPEYFEGYEMGKAADSWMWGMMGWQCLSEGKEPFDYCPYDRVVGVFFASSYLIWKLTRRFPHV